MIELKNVSMIYPNGNAALRNIDLTIEDNEFVFVVGQSGAGKTTLTKLLIAEERVSDGEMYVNDFKMHRLRRYKIPKLRRSIGMVFQDFRLFDNKTVYENVAFAMRVVGARPSEIKKRVPHVLSLVGLAHRAKSYPDKMSGGERQRIAIARALVNNPDIIIADEPTGNIDPEMSKQIFELLMRINKMDKTIIVVTHDHNMVNYYNKRVIKIENGHIVSDTPAKAAPVAVTQEPEAEEEEGGDEQ